MNKHVLALSTALSILVCTPAFAQDTTAATPAATTQMTTGELIVPADRLSGAQVMSASDYIGKTVYDQAGNNIGDVNDLILANNGEIQAVILGVGGFLGIGEKDVAVNTRAVQMVQDGDSMRLVVQTSKEALQNAPSYDRANRRYATGTGTGTTGTTGTGSDATGSTTAPATGTGTTTGTGTGTAPAANSGATEGTVDCSQPANSTNAACAGQTQQQ